MTHKSKRKKKRDPFYYNRTKVITYTEFMTNPEYKQYWDRLRWQVFKEKGQHCIRCGIQGKYVVFWKEFNSDNMHIDLAARNSRRLVMMTLDHFIPKSLGGPKTLENLDPMCHGCNQRKGTVIPLGPATFS